MHHAMMMKYPFNIFQAVTLNFLFQAVIDANIFPVLIEILGKAEFKTRKEAAWAITNATSGGTAEQIRYLVDQGCIPPLCDLLTVMDGKIVQVALNGLENILRLGDQDAKAHKGVNPYAVLIEECYGELKNSCTDLWVMS
jgi:importin subunit alpha-2